MPKKHVEIPASAHDLELFRLAAEHAPTHIIFTDTDGFIRYANPAAEKITGYTRKEMIGKRPSLWGGQMPKEFYLNMWRTIKDKKQVFHATIHNKRKDGSAYIAEATITPVIEKGKLVGFVGVERDITNEKKLFDSLAQSTQRFQYAMSAVRGAVWEWDVPTGQLEFSEGIKTIFGYQDTARFVTIDWWSTRIHPDDAQRVTDSLDRAFASQKSSWSDVYRFKNGKERYVHVQDFAVITYRGRKPLRLVGMFRDDSERHILKGKVNKLMRDSEIVLASMMEGVMTLDAKGTCIFVNDAAARMLDYAPGDLVGKKSHALIHHTREDGRPYPAKDCTILSRFSSNSTNPLRQYDVFWRKDGKPLPVSYVVSPVLQDGKPAGGTITFLDATEQRRVEEKAHELDTLKNKFIQVVSHQFRTPLNEVRWSLDALLNKQLGPLTAPQEEFARQTSEMNAEIIRRLDDLLTALDIEEGHGHLSLEESSLEDIVASVVNESAKRCQQKGLTCTYVAPKRAVPAMSLDSDKIRRVTEKLIDNAIAYNKKKGSMRVTIERNGSWVRVSVADRGIGVPNADRKRIFSRFYRASNASRVVTDASGLGLYIARHFVRAHEGKMGFTSTEGKGSTFWFDLPIRSV